MTHLSQLAMGLHTSYFGCCLCCHGVDVMLRLFYLRISGKSGCVEMSAGGSDILAVNLLGWRLLITGSMLKLMQLMILLQQIL